jgi:hypothetical protein
MTMPANIACMICGARPFPQLGPPETAEDHNLRKLKLVERKTENGKTKWWAPADAGEGDWFCSAHWRNGPCGPRGELTYVVVKP